MSTAAKRLWIQRAIKRPGAFRRMLERAGAAHKGENIPFWIKKEECRKPRQTYHKVFGHIPHHQMARLFQRRACAALTFMNLPPSRGRRKAKVIQFPGRRVIRRAA